MLIVGDGGAAWEPALFWALFLLFLAGELWLQCYRQLPAQATDRDRGSRWLVGGSVWVAIGPAVAASRLMPSPLQIPSPALFAAGLGLMAIGIGVRWIAVAQLGDSFTVEVGTHLGQRVRDRGAYRLVRHPSYTGSLATVLGILLCCTNWVALALILLPALGYANRIRVEEAALVEGLGEAYRAYMRRTKRLIPFLL
ncbi:MAG TPA: isoprenylcysteine carboxylmethyltransferase family protein [Verrucomicrobiae bacterium]|nr:isoprenylcysteine carboxylmethyltransferase family protein [Verrucomicrobiae bacterium]